MFTHLLLLDAQTKSIFYSTPGVWNVVIQLGIIAALMLIANALRRNIPFVRKSLMPVSVIAGFLMLAIRLVLEKGFKIETVFDKQLLDTLVYHCIALGFIAMSLRVAEGREKGRKDAVGARSGALIVGTYLVQGLVGLLVTVGLALAVKPDLFKAAGLLLPMGYGQGPGQANNIGMTYESFGFKGGQSFGLAIAAAGYICACRPTPAPYRGRRPWKPFGTRATRATSVLRVTGRLSSTGWTGRWSCPG